MPTQILVPELGESIVEATVSRWLKKEGERVAVGEAVVELETEKVNLEVGASAPGVLARIERGEGEDVRVGDVLGLVEPAAEAAAPAPPGEPKPDGKARPQPEAPSPPAGAAPAEGVGAAERATPVAKRMAEAEGIDLSRVPPSAPGARVTKEDVEAFIERHRAERPAPTAAPPAAAPAPPPAAAPPPAPAVPAPEWGAREERVRMSRRRRTIARRLVEAQQTSAMLTTFNEIDMSAVVELRGRRKEPFRERHGIGLGFMSFFVKASVGALKQFPMLNAEIQGEEIVVKHYHDIGIAVGAEEGLVVPVLRDADRMSFAEIEKRIKEFSQKAQDQTLSLEDLRGGTFTITNGGVFGSLLSTPILNFPQVGILGMHKIEARPIARDGQVVVRPMMYVALSYDHRIVDGREAVQFLVRVKELVEDPESLLLEG